MSPRVNKLRARLAVAVVLPALALSLSGCETFRTANANIASTGATASADMQSMASYPQDAAGITHDQPLILGSEVASSTSSDGQSNQLFDQHVGLTTGVDMSLDQIASLITQETNIPVQVSTQVDGFLNGTQSSNSGVPLPGLPGQTGTVTAPNIPTLSAGKNQLSVDCNSSLRSCLDQVAAKAGVFWKYSDGSVQFFLTDTRIYSVNALPGQASMTASISNAGSSGGSSGGSTSGTSNSTQQTAGITGTIDIYKSIQDSIDTILAETQSAGGSGTNLNVPTSVATDPASGQVIVTATPPELDAVDRYMKPLNQDLAKNVLIDLHIYSVQLNSGNNYGLNLSAAFSEVASRYGLSFTGAAAPALPTGGATASAYILSAPAAGQGGLTTPTQGIVQALATQGNVSLDTEGSVIAMNGQPTPLQVAQNKAYIASSSVNNTVNAGTSTSLTPGQYTVGFTGTFLPMVRGNEILLQFNANLTQDLGLLTQTSNGTEIQLPQTATQSFLQRVAMHSGETLVLSGFEQTSDQTTRNGVGASWFFLAGGGRAAQHAKQALVVVIHVEDVGT